MKFRTPRERQTAIEDHVLAVFRANLTLLVWPEILVTDDVGDGFGTHEEVIEALESMVRDGKLDARVQVHSSEGHLCWEGSPDQFVRLEPFRCPDLDCEEQIDELQEHATTYFVFKPESV